MSEVRPWECFGGNVQKIRQLNTSGKWNQDCAVWLSWAVHCTMSFVIERVYVCGRLSLASDQSQCRCGLWGRVYLYRCTCSVWV